MLDDHSEIIDFYPSEFFVDTKGKRFAWMGEVIVPMIDEDRLIKAVRKHEGSLTPEELERNKKGTDLLYINVDSPIMKYIQETVNTNDIHGIDTKMTMDYHIAEIGANIHGYSQSYRVNKNYEKPYACDAIEDIKENGVIAMAFINPPHKVHLFLYVYIINL